MLSEHAVGLDKECSIANNRVVVLRLQQKDNAKHLYRRFSVLSFGTEDVTGNSDIGLDGDHEDTWRKMNRLFV